MQTQRLVVIVQIDGAMYKIPETWFVGVTTGPLKMTVHEAIQHWHEQAQMEAACRAR